MLQKHIIGFVVWDVGDNGRREWSVLQYIFNVIISRSKFNEWVMITKKAELAILN